MTNVYNWSTTPADNDDADGSLWPEGMAPSQVNNSARDNMASLARFLSDISGRTPTTGSSNAYVFTPATPIEALVNGLVICIRANHSNTGAATINVNALGVKKIRKFDTTGDVALTADNILSGNHYLLQYNEAADSAAGAWIILNPSSTAADIAYTAADIAYDDTSAYSGAENVQEALEESANYTGFVETQAMPQNFVYGLTLSNNGTDANNDIDIATGQARGNSVTVTNSATLTKRLDASWAEGTNQGGLDTGSKANSTTYHVHAIRKDTGGTFDALFSTSATSPTVPSGWTRVQRLGAVLTDGSGNIRSFRQVGNTFWHNVSGGIQDFSAAGVWTKNLFVFSVPNGIRVEGIFQPLILANAAAVGHVILYDGENPNVSVILSAGSLNAGGGPVVSYNRSPMKQFTNASRQIYVEMTSGVNPSTPSAIATLGWNDYQIPRIGA